MSGYLKRIATGARNPNRSIHPVVGSLFATPKSETPPPVLEGDISFGSRPERPTAQIPEVPRTPVLETYGLDQDSHRPTNEDEDSPRVHTPLMPTPPERVEPAVRSIEMSSETPASKEQAEPSGNEQPGPRPKPGEPQRQEVTLRVPYQPLIEESIPRTDAHTSLVPDSGLRAPGAIGKDQRDFPRRAAAERPAQDEIQIHIGRIEVTALPQTPARPAAPVARKALNLDEYLKRGRGRA
jgi:hypothetical protein